LAVAGAKALLMSMGWPVSGVLLPALCTVILSLLGVGWQLSNIGRWAHVRPVLRDPLEDKPAASHH
jgi:hypothetical protein